MKIASLLEKPRAAPEAASVPDERPAPDIEFDFPMMGVFVTSARPSQELLAWLRNTTMGPYAIKYFADDHAVIAVSTKYDAYSLYGAFQAELEVSVVQSSRPAADVVRDIDRRNARS
ncbi:MAG: hypothetical protein ACLGJC_18360 [Alphaproteobacteria bacterium]